MKLRLCSGYMHALLVQYRKVEKSTVWVWSYNAPGRDVDCQNSEFNPWIVKKWQETMPTVLINSQRLSRNDSLPLKRSKYQS